MRDMLRDYCVIIEYQKQKAEPDPTPCTSPEMVRWMRFIYKSQFTNHNVQRGMKNFYENPLSLLVIGHWDLKFVTPPPSSTSPSST